MCEVGLSIFFPTFNFAHFGSYKSMIGEYGKYVMSFHNCIPPFYSFYSP